MSRADAVVAIEDTGSRLRCRFPMKGDLSGPTNIGDYLLSPGAAGLSSRVAAAAESPGAPGRRKWPLVESADVLDALSLLEAARANIDHREVVLLRHARARGVTWKQIAAALGFESPQAAQQRYRRLGVEGSVAALGFTAAFDGEDPPALESLP